MSSVHTYPATIHHLPEDPSQTIWAPSVFNITSIIPKMKEEWAQFQEAVSTQDREAKRNAYVRFLEHPFLAGHSIITLINLSTGLAMYLGSSYSYLIGLRTILGVVAPVLGLPLATLELMFTACNLKRDYHFAHPFNSSHIPLFDGKNPEKWLKTVREQWMTLKTLLPLPAQEKIEKLLTENNAQELSTIFLESDLLLLKEKYLCSEEKKRVLARRMQPWLEEEIERDVDPLLEKLQAKDPSLREQGRMEATKLLQNVQIQIIKKKVSHFLALFAMALTITALILSLVPACPYLVPTMIIAGATILVLTHCLYTAGYWNSKGWVFKWSHCAPNFLKTLWSKIHPPKKQEQQAPYQMRFCRFPFQHRSCHLRVKTGGTYKPHGAVRELRLVTHNAFHQERGRHHIGEVHLYRSPMSGLLPYARAQKN